MGNELDYNTEGDLSLLKDDSLKLAIIGSRSITSYTKYVLEDLFTELRNFDFCIVSGGMYGVDMYSHNLALKHNLKTILVLAEGIESYKNSSLYNQIRFSGNSKFLFLSKYPGHAKPKKYSFLDRNKLIVNLSSCLLVAQASLKSGSIFTANFALKNNKNIYSIPISLDVPKFQGTNFAINQGSKIYLNPSSILDFFSLSASYLEESIKYTLSKGPLSFRTLKNNIDANEERLNKELLKLILNGEIIFDGDKYRL